MAEYDENKLVRLSALKALAEKVKADFATNEALAEVISQVEGLEIPQNVSDLTNDLKFQTEAEVSAAIAAAIAKEALAGLKKVDTLPFYEEAEDNVLYLYKNEKTQHFDIYAKVEGSNKLEWLDDVTVDLDNYITTEKLTAELEKKANVEHTHEYAGAAEPGGSANSAVKLDTDTAGSDIKPVYFSDGIPVEGAHTIQSDVPADAKFTDTTYKPMGGASTDAAGTEGLVPKPEAGNENSFLKGDGTWAVPPDTDTTYERATGSSDGLMSMEDKTKLDGISIASEQEVTDMIKEVLGA